MTDQLLANVTGVFEDLDDGGLTDSEALEQIRGIIKVKPPLPDQIVFSVLIPATITFDRARSEVTEFEVDYDSAYRNVDQPAETRKSGDPIDSAEFGEEIDAAWVRAFGDTGAWPEPERM